MIRIYELNLVMSRDIMRDHTWDPSLAETVPFLWAFIQAAAAVIITTLPSLALGISIWYRKKRPAAPARIVPSPLADSSPIDIETAPSKHSSDPSKASNGEATPLRYSATTTTTASIPTTQNSSTSRPSKAEKVLGLGQRFKRSRTPDEYSEDAAYRLDPISGITVTRTVNVTSAIDPNEGFKVMYRKYCGVA